MDFIRDSLGRPFIATAMRRVSELFFAGSTEWFREFGIVAPARTASLLLLLENKGALSITEIAVKLRQSHPTIIEWARALSELGLVTSRQSSQDRRRNLVSLTSAGEADATRIARALAIVAEAYARMCAEIGDDIFESLLKLEAACADKSMLDRLRDAAGAASSQPTGSKSVLT